MTRRDSESLENSETEDFSQTVGFFEEALEQAGQGRAQTRDTSKECSAIFWRSQDPSCSD